MGTTPSARPSEQPASADPSPLLVPLHEPVGGRVGVHPGLVPLGRHGPRPYAETLPRDLGAVHLLGDGPSRRLVQFGARSLPQIGIEVTRGLPQDNAEPGDPPIPSDHLRGTPTGSLPAEDPRPSRRGCELPPLQLGKFSSLQVLDPLHEANRAHDRNTVPPPQSQEALVRGHDG